MALVGYLVVRMTPQVTPHITIRKAATILRTTPREVAAMVEDGSLDSVDMDGRLRVSLFSVNRLWAEHARAELREMGVLS